MDEDSVVSEYEEYRSVVKSIHSCLIRKIGGADVRL